MVARMSRASTIREGIANAYRGTAAKRQIRITWNAPFPPGSEPIRIVPLSICKKESLVVVESICVDSDEANVLEQGTSAFEELVPAETDGHLGQ